MPFSKTLSTVLLISGLLVTSSAFATTTYTYTSTSSAEFSGRFSVDTGLVNGSYSFLDLAARPAGFTENFFTTPFIDGRGSSRLPSLSLFNITIANGQVSNWDIRATTPFTFVTTGTGGRGYSKVYHDNATLIFHATNQPYLPANGAAYQSTITEGDYKTYYASGFAYQEALTGAYSQAGTWSASTVPLTAVAEPESYSMLILGLGMMGWLVRRRKPVQR
jgi:hypothetical protein